MEKRQEARPKEKGISRPRRLNHNEVIPRIEQSQDEVDSPLAVAVARAVQDVMRGKRLLRLLISEDDEEGALQMILEIEKIARRWTPVKANLRALLHTTSTGAWELSSLQRSLPNLRDVRDLQTTLSTLFGDGNHFFARVDDRAKLLRLWLERPGKLASPVRVVEAGPSSPVGKSPVESKRKMKGKEQFRVQKEGLQSQSSEVDDRKVIPRGKGKGKVTSGSAARPYHERDPGEGQFYEDPRMRRPLDRKRKPSRPSPGPPYLPPSGPTSPAADQGPNAQPGEGDASGPDAGMPTPDLPYAASNRLPTGPQDGNGDDVEAEEGVSGVGDEEGSKLGSHAGSRSDSFSGSAAGTGRGSNMTDMTGTSLSITIDLRSFGSSVSSLSKHDSLTSLQNSLNATDASAALRSGNSIAQTGATSKVSKPPSEATAWEKKSKPSTYQPSSIDTKGQRF